APRPTSPLWSSSIRLKHSFPLGGPQQASLLLSPFFHTDRGYRYVFPLVLWRKPCYNTDTGTPYGCAGRAARRRRPTGGLLWCESNEKRGPYYGERNQTSRRGAAA